MTSYSILDWFVKLSGYRTDSTNGSIEFTVDDITQSLLPSAYSLFSKLALKTYSSIDFNSSTGDQTDDIIIAHIASYYADSIYDKVHINPETGLPVNRHWDAAKQMILSVYGVYDPRVGEFVFPGQGTNIAASTYMARVDSSVTDWQTMSTTSVTVYPEAPTISARSILYSGEVT